MKISFPESDITLDLPNGFDIAGLWNEWKSARPGWSFPEIAYPRDFVRHLKEDLKIEEIVSEHPAATIKLEL